MHRNDKQPDPTSPAVVELEKEAAAVAQENNWQAYRRKAGIETHLVAGLIFILPKVGPLALVNIKGPTEQTEADYAHSVAVSTAALRRVLSCVHAKRAARFKGPLPPLGGAYFAPPP